MTPAIQIAHIVAAILGMAMVGGGVAFGVWFGARLTARLMGREEPIFRDPPSMEMDELDLDEMEST